MSTPSTQTRSIRALRPCVAVLLLVLFLAPGCAQKFTRENWEMIEVGASTKDEVKFVLGSPMDRGKEVWWYNRGWNDAFIYFNEKDVVKAKKWYNGKTNEKEVCPPGWSDQK